MLYNTLDQITQSNLAIIRCELFMHYF